MALDAIGDDRPKRQSSQAGTSDEPGLVQRVLVVDDDVDICGLVAFKLSSLGFEVLVQHDGEAGLTAARIERPDLIILDWMMPRLTGIEVCVAIRADPILESTPVILLTAKAQEADVARGFLAGVNDYLVKPFSPRELAGRVQNLLARSHESVS